MWLLDILNYLWDSHVISCDQPCFRKSVLKNRLQGTILEGKRVVRRFLKNPGKRQ
jgi:hypothetical protein